MRVCLTINSGQTQKIFDTILGRVDADLEYAAQFLTSLTLLELIHMNLIKAYAKEESQSCFLEITCVPIGGLGPDFLERAHLLSRDRLCAAGHLEDIVEALDDHTSEQVGEDVLSNIR